MSGLLSVKLRRDLRASWSRYVLMVLAFTVCLTALGGVLFAWGAGGREAGGAYASTEPASATLVLDRGVEPARMDEALATVRSRPGVTAATGRAQFDSQVQVNGRARAIPVQTFAATPDDPMRVARFDLKRPGSWPPSPGEIYLAADSLPLLGAKVGDTLTVKLPDAGATPLRIAGTVYDPSLSPSMQEQKGHGYLSTETLAAATGTPARLDQVKIQVADPGGTEPTRDRERVVAVAREVAAGLNGQGLTVREVQAPAPYAHPHQWQFDALLGSLLAGAAAALLLAAILVATMLNSLFIQQIPQIGIMKAIGARSGHVARQYATLVLLVAAVATLLAAPVAVLSGRLLVDRLITMLGIEPVSVAAPAWTYPAFALLGLTLPPLMALSPLVRASRTTVRAAIDHHGGATNPSRMAGMLARLSRVRRLDRGLLMALRNTVRRPARFWLSTGLLAGAGAVFVAGMSLGTATQAVEEQMRLQRYWDADVRLAVPAATADATEPLGDVPGVARVEGWNVQTTGIAGPGQVPVTRTYPDQGHGRIAVSALPPGGSGHRPPEILEGRWLRPGETGALVLNETVRKNSVPGVAPGNTVQLSLYGEATTWRVAGIANEREGSGVYVTAAGLAAATGRPQQVNQLRIVTDRHDEPVRAGVAAAAATALAEDGLKVADAASISRSNATSSGHLGPIIIILVAVAAPLGVVGAIGLASTMGANVLDRTREFGVLHAIGAAPRTVRRIVTAEGLVLALAGCLVAVVPALVLTAVLTTGFGNLFMSAPLPYRVSIPAAVIWPVVALLAATLATESAATRASRITVREALAQL